MADKSIDFTFEGAALTSLAGKSVAAALTDAGHRAFRQTITGEQRGIFCGMGVCQECLMTIDGVANQRACMTPVQAGMKVETQTPLADLSQNQEKVIPAIPGRVIVPDVLVIGGGAGGLSAAIAAARTGAKVVLLDERGVEGGQYFKQSAVGAGALDSQQMQGSELIAQARQSGVEIIRDAQVWGAFDGPLLLADCSGESLIARPKKLIIATGAYERPLMVPGWTLPGVMTTGAAQTLWRSYRSLAGKRVAVCGSGPLNLQVARELADGGADVRLVAEAAPAAVSQPVAATAMAIYGPRLAAKGLMMLHALRRKRVPIHHRTRLMRIDRYESGLKAVFRGPEDRDITVEVDAVCMNAGFEPQNEILRLLGAKMQYDQVSRQLRCARDDQMATSVEHVYAVGDCAGLGGAPAAIAEGQIAGAVAAAAAGFGVAGALRAEKRELRRHRRFQRHLWQLYNFDPQPVDVADDTIVCRCEEVTLGALKASVSDAPNDIGAVKRSTRLGMGRCQGRYCGPAAIRFLAQSTQAQISDLSYFAPRAPVKPVAISAIVAAQETLNEQD